VPLAPLKSLGSQLAIPSIAFTFFRKALLLTEKQLGVVSVTSTGELTEHREIQFVYEEFTRAAMSRNVKTECNFNGYGKPPF